MNPAGVHLQPKFCWNLAVFSIEIWDILDDNRKILGEHICSQVFGKSTQLVLDRKQFDYRTFKTRQGSTAPLLSRRVEASSLQVSRRRDLRYLIFVYDVSFHIIMILFFGIVGIVQSILSEPRLFVFAPRVDSPDAPCRCCAGDSGETSWPFLFRLLMVDHFASRLESFRIF